MVVVVDMAWQPSLFDGGGAPGIDVSFAGCRRHRLGDGAWVDVVPGWLAGAEVLFAELLAAVPWRGHRVRMYDRVVAEPRLTHRWDLAGGPSGPPAPLPWMAEVLSARYGVRFGQIGSNLYRDGSDSVAWHGDRVARQLTSSTVALVSLGATRPFRLRPTCGGRSVDFHPSGGDLLVMGGSCQRTWQHAVPKVRQAGPRISVQFRHTHLAHPARQDGR